MNATQPADNVKTPAHYTQFKFQPLDFIRANKNVLDFLQANVIKYVCRFKLKNGKEDLLKARNYLDIMIEEWDKDHELITATDILKSLADKPMKIPGTGVIQRYAVPEIPKCNSCAPEKYDANGQPL